MRPFDHRSAQAVITSSFAWVALTTTIVLVTILLTTSAELSNATGTRSDPLSLFAITKSPQPGGDIHVSMALLPNFGIFVAAAALAAALLAFTRMQLRR
ncbi:MAG: hypothetical protein K0S68_154 [Candidatus Saccharibacteria bacterium]|jgi:hypothetical protein|nr:hypothetical protein [Candidatus Saccharibacteria bacterium]